MAEFLGYTIMHPVIPGFVDDERDAAADGVEQITSGGLRKRYTLSFNLEADTEVEANGAQTVLSAHKNRYGTGRAFGFHWEHQGTGIVVPDTVTRNSGAKAIGADLVLFSEDVPVGAYFAFAGFRTLYQVAEAGAATNSRYIEPPLVNAIADQVAADFSPVIQAKHRANSAITHGWNDQGIAVPRVSLIESR